MSVLPAMDPSCTSCASTPAIATIIDARPRDIGGFKVGRLLPSTARRAGEARLERRALPKGTRRRCGVRTAAGMTKEGDAWPT